MNKESNNLKRWYLNLISDIIEDLILLELERSSNSRQVVVPIEREYLQSVLTYVEHKFGYNTKINNDEIDGILVPVVISW